MFSVNSRINFILKTSFAPDPQDLGAVFEVGGRALKRVTLAGNFLPPLAVCFLNCLRATPAVCCRVTPFIVVVTRGFERGPLLPLSLEHSVQRPTLAKTSLSSPRTVLGVGHSPGNMDRKLAT